jgi:hypothetical protein
MMKKKETEFRKTKGGIPGCNKQKFKGLVFQLILLIILSNFTNE